MKATTAALVLAGAVGAVPQYGSGPFNPHAYNAHHYHGRAPFGFTPTPSHHKSTTTRTITDHSYTTVYPESGSDNAPATSSSVKACKPKTSASAPAADSTTSVFAAAPPSVYPYVPASSRPAVYPYSPVAPGASSSRAYTPQAPRSSSTTSYSYPTPSPASTPAYTPSTPLAAAGSSSAAYFSSVPSAPAGSSSVASSSSEPTAAAGSTGVPSSATLKPTSSGTATTTGKVQAAGINIAGCDFGCDTSGNCNSGSQCPTSVGPTQMQHFASDDGLNIFRLPVGWQYLVANKLGGPLDETYLAGYDGIVKACLATNARCIIDIHNYARWNGQIVGQTPGGPTNDDLASVWSQLAKKYAAESNVVFGIMNEPHDLDMDTWANTTQAAVTAIRNAGATSQWILLPGTSYTSAGGFQINSAPALKEVKNLDGSTDNLIYDVHNYYDSDSSGKNQECVTDHVSDRFQPLGDYLRQAKRQAFISEMGGGNTASCEQYVCSSLDFVNSYSDVYLGWTGWGAGSFDASYTLSLTPTGNTDKPLVSQCIAGKFKSA